MKTTYTICTRLTNTAFKLCDYETNNKLPARTNTLYVGIGTLELARKMAQKYVEESGLKDFIQIWIESDGDESGFHNIYGK